MDKESIIIKYEQSEIEESKEKLDDLSKSTENQSERLAKLQAKMDALYKKAGKTKLVEVPVKSLECEDKPSEEANADSTSKPTFDELYEKAALSLKERGLDIESIDYSVLIDDAEMKEVLEELDQPLPREDKWNKFDFLVVFIAALVGGALDIVLGDRNNKFTGQGSEFSKKLNEVHESKWKHSGGAPIDFQGKIGNASFGGGKHRELSKGHDLLRFAEGIKSFKEGKFEATVWNNGVKTVVTSTATQYGNPYQEMTLIAAIMEYAHHMLADLMSTNSLPFPGYSFLRESNSRTLRTLSADLYSNGFNLKNIIIQAASSVAIEVLIRLYFSIQSVKKYKDSVEVAEDYSNWKAIKEFFIPTNKDKLHEMLLVAHTIVMGINIGKIVITKNVADINVTEIMSVVKYGIQVTKAAVKRNGEYGKLIYHSEQVASRWEAIEKEISGLDEDIVAEMKEELVVA